MKDKKHLTREGLEVIRKIKAGMNSRRSYEESETSKGVFLKNNNIKTNSTIIHKRGFHSNVSVVSLMVLTSHNSYVRTNFSCAATDLLSSFNRSIFSRIWKKSQPLHSLAKRELSGDYIAGFVQADGSFSATLTRKTRGDKEYFNISLVFTIVQSQKYKDLILEIQKMFGGIGQ
jgi:hypothetical protein